MTEDYARIWLINVSLGLSGVFAIFTILSPALGYPLEFDQALRLTEIVFPVFFGYLGSAVSFVIGRGRKSRVRQNSSALLSPLVKGPVFLFGVGGLAAFLAFGISNGSDAPPGTGMSVDTLALIFTGLVGLLAVTTGALVAYLFRAGEREAPHERGAV